MYFIVWDVIVNFLSIPLVIRWSTLCRFFQYWNWHFITLPRLRGLIDRLSRLDLLLSFLLCLLSFRWSIIRLPSCTSIRHNRLLFFLDVFFNGLHPFFRISRVRRFICPLSIKTALLLLLFFLLLLLAVNNSVFECTAVHHGVLALIPVFVFRRCKCLLLLRCKLNSTSQVRIVFLDLGQRAWMRRGVVVDWVI